MPVHRRPRVPRAGRARSSKRAGFTLLELMIVVTIIMVTAAIAAPGAMSALASSRANRATHDVVRIGRRARTEAIVTGRAHLLRMSNGRTGRLELWRGISNQCEDNDWTAIATSAGCDNNDRDCVDLMAASLYDTASHYIELTVPAPAACFEPDGDMLVQGAGGRFVLPAQALRIQIRRFQDGTRVDVDRGAIFPALAAPRVER